MARVSNACLLFGVLFMKLKQLSFILTSAIALSACSTIESIANAPLKSKLRTLELVKENHAVVEKDNQKYMLDTYYQPFQRPYYIHVRTENNISIKKATAVKLAEEYIKPRGCTAPIERPWNSWDYDINTFADKEWLIYIEC